MDKKLQINLGYVFVALLIWLAFQSWYDHWRRVEPIPYSEFVQLLDEGKINDVVIGRERIAGKFTQPQPDGRDSFITYRVDPSLAERLSQHGIRYNGEVESSFIQTLMAWVLPIAIFFLFWSFIFRRFAEKQGFGGQALGYLRRIGAPEQDGGDRSQAKHKCGDTKWLPECVREKHQKQRPDSNASANGNGVYHKHPPAGLRARGSD